MECIWTIPELYIIGMEYQTPGHSMVWGHRNQVTTALGETSSSQAGSLEKEMDSYQNLELDNKVKGFMSHGVFFTQKKLQKSKFFLIDV